jgi:hypothetical protein
MSVGALCGGYMAGLDPEEDLRSAMNFIGKYNATLNPSAGGFEADDIRAALMRGISIYPWTFRGDINTYKNHLLWGYSGLTGDNANVFRRIARNIAYTPASTTVEIGTVIPMELNVTGYNHETSTDVATAVTVLAGNELVQIENGQMTFTGAGDVTYLFSYDVKVNNATIVLHTQPVTLTVSAATSDETDTIEPETQAPDAETTQPTTDTTDAPDTEEATQAPDAETTQPTTDTTDAPDTEVPTVEDTTADATVTESTAAATTAPVTDPETETEAKTGGCGSALGGMALLLMAGAAVVAMKKKND